MSGKPATVWTEPVNGPVSKRKDDQVQVNTEFFQGIVDAGGKCIAYVKLTIVDDVIAQLNAGCALARGG